MSKELVISANTHETRVAIVEDGQLCEIYIEREKEFALVGSIYKGRVTRVLPGMQSAFVEIGLDSDAFLYVSDFLENLEEYDHVVNTVENKVQKMEQQGGEVFTPAAAAPAESSAGPQESNAAPQESAPAPTQPEATGGGAAAQHIVTAMPGETLGAASTASHEPGSTPPSAPLPFQRRDDRGPRNFGGHGNRGRDRGGDRGGDRGRRGSGGGRWGRRGGGGRDQRHGRDLPPSKYSSPRPFDSRPYEPPPANYEPVILPGESLAKYKDRVPAAPNPPESRAPAETENLSAAPPVEIAHEQSSAGLPQSLYAATAASPESVHETQFEEHAEEHFVEAAPPSAELHEETQTHSQETHEEFHEHEPEAFQAAEAAAEPHEEIHAAPGNGGALSEEEVSSLAEQLAEAKHEEAQAEAEDLAAANEAALEPFAEAAEIEELHEEHEEEGHEEEGHEEEDHESDVAAAEAEADEMHDAAIAADAEAHGEETPEPGNVAPVTEIQPTQARVSDQPRARFQRPMRRGGRNRGGRPTRPGERPQHGGGFRRHAHQAPRRPQLISEMLKAGQEIIVQIAKEPLGKKGARITSHVALPGRYLVYMPTVDHIGVSRRIGSAEDRSRLRRLVNESKGTFPGGFIVRTAAAGASDEEIRSDVEFLGKTWDTIRNNSEQRHAPSLLHRDLNLVERILRDYLSDDYAAIWIDNEEEFSKVVEFVSRFQPRLVGRVKLYTKDAPIFEEFGIQQELDKALKPKVWLKSGGYIVINHTEALVAIDVNTGKYVGRGSTRLEDTIVKTNLEAVKEIIRQIRLRDLGGIIVVDFIDMEERRNREKVMAALDAALGADRAPSKALIFNEFGLVCITRKRTKQALERVLCQPCPYCTGSGMVKSIPTICYEILAEARKMSADLDSPSLTLRVHPEIAKALKTRESGLIEELEQATRKSAIIQSDATLHWEQYDIY